MIFGVLDRHYKKLALIPVVLLVISIFILAGNILTHGSILERDTELVGGKMISMSVGGPDIQGVKSILPEASVRLTKGVGSVLIVEIPVGMDEFDAFSRIKGAADARGEPTYRTVGPVIGDLFFQQTQIALVAAFIMMSIIVFIVFRSPVPSSIVVFAAATDIIVTVAVMSFLEMKLSMATIAALMTLIGYSVDTDILLTTNMLKSKDKEIRDRIKTAMKTGLTLTTTTLVALAALYFTTGSFIIEQIAVVLIIGLVIDIFATWLTNAGILRYWMERKNESA
ncbi:MAG: protein translocase subunit SecF [Candidatus Aenigmarchaeota archaeon]|nr:protein translocase subunit SecF [Candidatus Aenigmarchaeota archaeon]